jgi:hypothetical protein
VIVAVPTVTPVTTPPEVTVALPLLLLHVPPGVVLVSVTVVVMQMLAGPVMGATTGSGLTVTTAVAAIVPQLLVTV